MDDDKYKPENIFGPFLIIMFILLFISLSFMFYAISMI